VGGGDVALEDAIYLSKICSKVTLIHRRDEFRAAKVLADQIEKTENIDFLPFTQIKEISGEPGNLQLTLINTAKNEQAGINVAGVFIAVGMLPVTQFAEGVVGLDDTGYVVAGEDCKTNVAGIFAAGDVRTKNVRQVATAVGDGASVIASVEEFLTR
jgi:thioredoxin reductase (NADPH)